jgi:hypothetical protein
MHNDSHEIEFGTRGKQMVNGLVGDNVVVCESSNDEYF